MKYFLLLVSLPLFGTTSIGTIQVSQSQAMVPVTTDQAGFCTYRVSLGTSFAANIPDIFDNGATDARNGSLISGSSHKFIVGTRKGNDALSQQTTYWVGVTCGTDAEVGTTFTTLIIPFGYTQFEPPPFDQSKFGNVSQGTFDWGSDRSRSVVDPTTGVRIWRVTGPTMDHRSTLMPAIANAGVLANPTNTTNWTTPSNITSNNATGATAAGGPADKIFIPFNYFNDPAGGGGMAGFYGGIGDVIDDIMLVFYCGNAAAATSTFSIQMSVDGGQTGVGNVLTTPACPVGATRQNLGTFPSTTPNPMFQGWGYIPTINNRMPPSGTVNTNGTSVTLTGFPQGTNNWFNRDWVAGTPILINGSYAHLAAAPTSTTLTTVENLGVQTNVAYTGAGFGFRIWKNDNNNTGITVSLGVLYAFGEYNYTGSNGDIPIHNRAPVSVTVSAEPGNCGPYTIGCIAGVISPPINGYFTGLFTAQSGCGLSLWIPFNSDGSPRAENRLISNCTKPAGDATVNNNGDGINPSLQGFPAFDDINGTVAYFQDASNRIYKLAYDSTLTTVGPGGSHSCAGFPAFHPYPATNDYNPIAGIQVDCFRWINITPLTGGKDVVTQTQQGYITGLNYLGNTVGPAHPGVNISFLNGIRFPVAGSNFICTGISQDARSDILNISSCFNTNLVSNVAPLAWVRDMWSFPNSTGLCGGHTSPVFMMGSWFFGVCHVVNNPGFSNRVFESRQEATVIRANRAGFGSTPNWDNNSSITVPADLRMCPSGIPAPYTSFSGTANCVQLELSTPLCNRTPNSTFDMGGGLHEKDVYPCSTPGFSFGPGAAAYSKLTDIQPGENWQTPGSERLVVMTTPTYNNSGSIYVWVLRTSGFINDVGVFSCCDDTNGQGHTSYSGTTQPDQFTVYKAAAHGSFSVAADVSNPANDWVADNPLRFQGHGSAGFSNTPGLYNYVQPGAVTVSGASYTSGRLNTAPAGHAGTALLPQAPFAPTFAGKQSSVTASSQSYVSVTQGQGALPFFIANDFRWPGGAGGSANEGFNLYGNTVTITLVPGTTHTYKFGADSLNSSPDYKRLAFWGYAGRFNMRDVSSTTVFGSIADLPNYSVCEVFKVNECVFGSSIGDFYGSIINPDITGGTIQCNWSTLGYASPCVSGFGTWVGQQVQFRLDQPEPTGLYSRQFGFGHQGIGTTYAYANCRPDPTGKFSWCAGTVLDGIRSDIYAVYTGNLPASDSINRTNFVFLPISTTGVPGATNVRARFGYAENNSDLLHCKPYAQCSTEIPVAPPTDPFSFTNETVTRQPCANAASCTVQIPALTNRMVYYVIDHLDNSGTIISSEAMNVTTIGAGAPPAAFVTTLSGKSTFTGKSTFQ